MTPKLLIIGLGNPGKEYEGTRHNVGRDVLAALARNQESGISAPGVALAKSGDQEWEQKRLLHAEILECDVADQRTILAKPTTYMNESGRAVAALVRNYRLSAIGYRLLIIHDDLDLPVGALRFSVDGSSGGQRGVQSIIDTLGTEEFLRLRIGIGPNTAPDGTRIPAEDFVLKRFPRADRVAIDAAITRAVETITILLRDGLPAAQRFANQ